MEQGPEPFTTISEGIIKSEIRAYLHRRHLRQYKNTALSEKGKTPLTLTLSKYKYRGFRVSGTHQRWLTWLLSGHSPLAYFQYRANNFTRPDCEHCPGEQETSLHFLCHCVGYMTIRLRIFGNIILTWDDILSAKLSTIILYIETTGRFDKEDLFEDPHAN